MAITIQCRDHGGTFQIQPKRGRRPVRCTRENACTRYPPGEVAAWVERAAQATPAQVARAVGRAENAPRGPWIVAKERLEAQGWLCQGRGWKDHYNGRDNASLVELTATRSEETIIMHWTDGELIQQDYSLWSEAPSANNKPAGSLSFNPDECTDRELVRALAGCKVTWWNVLGQKEEEATIAPESIKIEHAYNGHGDEQPSDRIVKFIEHGGAGFRAFRVGALLKVG